MAATQPSREGKPTSEDEVDDGQPRPIPDEDGPHDVPDEKVIEKTMPTGPVGDEGSFPKE